MSEVFQVILNGKRCSGRAVRFSPLSSPDHDQLSLDAAKQLSAESTLVELRQIEQRMGVRKMIVGVSKQTGATDLSKVTWDKPSASDLDQNWDAFFNTKDDVMLIALYHEFHNVSSAEMESVLGNVQQVSID